MTGPAPTHLLDGVLTATTPAGDRILLHVRSGTYLRLDGSAGAIVDLLASEPSEAAAAAALAAQYGIPAWRAETDVRGVVEALARLQPTRTARLHRPTPRRAVGRVLEWWRLPLADRVAVARVVVVLCVVEAGLRLTDIRRLAAVLRVPLADGAAGPTPPSSDLHELSPGELRLCRAIGWALSRWVLPGTCLRRSLLTGFFLRRRRPVLRLGLTPDGVTAHAWVEAGGVSYDPGETVGVFRAVG